MTISQQFRIEASTRGTRTVGAGTQPETPMYEQTSYRDHAFEQLTREFPEVSIRVVLAVFLRYLERERSLQLAIDATRARIMDVCAVPA